MKVRENQPKEVSLKTPTSPTNLYIFDKLRYAQWHVTQRTLSMYRSGWVKAEKLPPYRPRDAWSSSNVLFIKRPLNPCSLIRTSYLVFLKRERNFSMKRTIVCNYSRHVSPGVSVVSLFVVAFYASRRVVKFVDRSIQLLRHRITYSEILA